MGIEKVETGAAAQRAVRSKRFWVGWSSRRESLDTPFIKWKTCVTHVPGSDELSHGYAAVIDADDRETAWQLVAGCYADAEESFVKEKPRDFWPPADRFPRLS